MLSAAILAGGLATRLRPVTERIPKALIEINGEPFLAHQLRLLAERRVRRVVLCLGYCGEMVREFAGDGARFGVSLDYSFDGPALLGTAGAVRNALPLLGDEFFVLYGDSYLPCDYAAVARAFTGSGMSALMTVYRNEGRWDASNVELEGGRILAYDKRARTPRMRHIDYGLGAFRRDVFQRSAATDLADLYHELLGRGELAAFEVPQRFYEAGSFEGIRELSNMLFTTEYLREACEAISALDPEIIERLAALLAETRKRGGRLFVLGVGGSAANASHAVNDFRKLAGMEAYTPTDNVSELTARTNDEGWASVFTAWLRGSRLRADDCVLVLSVGGGDSERNISQNLVEALKYAESVGASIGGVVGRDGGHTARVANACVVVPTVNPAHITPHTEALQAVVLHLLVSHPALKRAETKWESAR